MQSQCTNWLWLRLLTIHQHGIRMTSNILTQVKCQIIWCPSEYNYIFSFQKMLFTTLILISPFTDSCSNKHKRKDGKPTRVRTVLSEKQLHTLRTCYGANPRPDALMKEQLVEMTGLSPRVIRVWFQNKRCKDKKKSMMLKHLQQQEKVILYLYKFCYYSQPAHPCIYYYVCLMEPHSSVILLNLAWLQHINANVIHRKNLRYFEKIVLIWSRELVDRNAEIKASIEYARWLSYTPYHMMNH